MRVKDIMEQDAYVCHANDSVYDVLKYFSEKKIGGLPVVDDDMKVVGFISDGDIMGFVSRKRPILLDFYEHSSVVYDDKSFDEKLSALMKMDVLDLATRRVLAVDADEYVEDVADILSRKKIKKLPVVENGKLVGVISRATITRYIMEKMIKEYDNK